MNESIDEGTITINNAGNAESHEYVAGTVCAFLEDTLGVNCEDVLVRVSRGVTRFTCDQTTELNVDDIITVVPRKNKGN